MAKPTNKINPKQFWLDLDLLYRNRLNKFVSIAGRYLYNKDHAIDVVHDAFSKATEYFNKHPERKPREQIMIWLILKAVKKKNKYSAEIPWGDSNDLCKLIDGQDDGN